MNKMRTLTMMMKKRTLVIMIKIMMNSKLQANLQHHVLLQMLLLEEFKLPMLQLFKNLVQTMTKTRKTTFKMESL